MLTKHTLFRKLFGRIKILHNEKYMVYDKKGTLKILEGPGNFFLYNSQYSKLNSFTIDKSKYLKITYLNGEIEHVSGPITYWEDPSKHYSIDVLAKWEILAGDTYLSYIHSTDGIKPNLIKGYTLYQPLSNETISKLLKRYSALENEYIEVVLKNGERKYIKGPYSLLEDPQEHDKVFVRPMKNIPSNRGILVYKKVKDQVKAIYIYGPTQYMPDGDEYIANELKMISAKPNQHLEVIHQSGKSEYLPGPYEMWEDPIKYLEINVKESTEVAKNEAIVVYKEKDGQILRTVYKGPILYHPSGKEWIHTFEWHGADPNNTRRKIPKALKFQKLWMMPDQVFLNIETARTKDDAILELKIMVFFELIDIEVMIDKTHDPIVDFWNSVTADLLEFTGKYSFEEFKNNIGKLNNLESYPQLITRSTSIGYKISKVVFRGYISTDALEKMHNNSIEIRTKLVIDREIEEKAQYLKDYKLEKDKQRQQEELIMEKMKNEHNINLELSNHQKELDKIKREKDQQIGLERKELEFNLEKELKLRNSEYKHIESLNQIEVNQRKNLIELEINKFKELNNLEVGLTEYMVALAKGKPDSWIQLENKGNTTPHIHLNETRSRL